MRLRWSLPVMTAALLLACAAPASAMTFRTAERGGIVSIGPNETIDDDLYAAGQTVDIRGTVRGNVFAAGNDVSVVGSVTGGVFAAGNSVRVGGIVRDGIHAAGSSVSLDASAGGDVMGAGANVVLSSQGSAARDAALAGNTVTLLGRVGRDAYLGGSEAVVSGDVGRNVFASAGTLRLTDTAQIGGDLRYTSPRTARIASGATVRGRTEYTMRRAPEGPSPAGRALLAVIGWVRGFIGMFLFGLLALLLFPLFFGAAAERIRLAPLPSLGIGFAVLVGTPFAVLTIFLIGLIVGGWWIALVVLALYWIAILVANVVAALFLGRWLLGAVHASRAHPVAAFALGLLVLSLAEAIPVLGALVGLAAVSFGLGATALTVFGQRSEPTAPAQMQPYGYPAPVQGPPVSR